MRNAPVDSEVYKAAMTAKDAEIERLKNIIAATEVERDAADKVCDKFRCDIERLKTEDQEAKSDFQTTIDSVLVQLSDAKKSLTETRKDLVTQSHVFRLECERHKALITELCDALEGVGPYDAIENMKLITRAREATR